MRGSVEPTSFSGIWHRPEACQRATGLVLLLGLVLGHDLGRGQVQLLAELQVRRDRYGVELVGNMRRVDVLGEPADRGDRASRHVGVQSVLLYRGLNGPLCRLVDAHRYSSVVSTSAPIASNSSRSRPSASSASASASLKRSVARDFKSKSWSGDFAGPVISTDRNSLSLMAW